MKRLEAVTEDFIKGETTYLTDDVAAGSSVSLPIENSDGYADDTFLAIGHAGSELCELEQINQAVSGASSVRVATLKFNHQKGEPVTLYRFNQRKFYGATSEDGSYTELTSEGSPKDIQVDDPQGTVLEYTGTTYTYFKATYYNSETAEETDIDDAQATLADESKRYASIWAIRKHAGLAGNPRYSDFRMETKRKQAENEIDSAIAARYILPLEEVPPLISQICELLGAGYIADEEFRMSATDTANDNEGAGWLNQARSMLKEIQKGTRLLIGADGVELSRNTKVDVLDGYPNSADVDEPKFSMDDRF